MLKLREFRIFFSYSGRGTCATVPIRTNSPKNRETPGNLAPLKAFLVNLVSITNCGLLDWLLDIAADRSRHPTPSFWKPRLLEGPP
jgi:hypothetical protein